MKPKTMILLLVAVGCGLTAAYLTAVGVTTPNRATMKYVAVAKEPIKANTKINTPEDFFVLKEFPKDSISPKAVSNFDDLRGKVTGHEIRPLLPLDLDEDFGSPLKILNDLPVGYRAVSVTTNIATAATGFIQPSSRVDILCTVNSPDDARKTITKVFLQNVLVLAVNNMQERSEDKGAIAAPATVTIAVTPKDAERVVWVTQRSAVYFALRKNGDSQEVRTPSSQGPFDNMVDPVPPIPGEPGAAAPMVKIPVAKLDVPEGTTIDDTTFGTYFEERLVPKDFAELAVLRSNLIGKKIYVKVLNKNYATQGNLLEIISTPRETRQLTIWNGPIPETNKYDLKTGLRIDDNAPQGPAPKAFIPGVTE
jgi:pilus assembly protein CpaB